MAMPIAPEYHTVFLFPPALEDWVPQDHYVRFLREFVDSLDLPGLGFIVPSGSEGRPPYATSLMLKLWLFGYKHQLFSTRQLERACRENLALIWLLGTLQPDHNSIWRFWRDNKQALREVFKQSVRVAVKVGLVGFALQAVDGTKIQAVASRHTGWTKEWMEQKLQEFGSSAGPSRSPGRSPADLGFGDERLPSQLIEKPALREQISSRLERIGANRTGALPSARTGSPSDAVRKGAIVCPQCAGGGRCESQYHHGGCGHGAGE